MSLIKEYATYSNKPLNEDKLINKLHQGYEDIKRDIQKKCPACRSEKYTFAFDKYSFHYLQCCDCLSLYVQNILCKDEVIKYEEYMKTHFYSTREYKDYLNTLIAQISFELELTFSRFFSKKQKLNVAYFGHKSDVYKNGLVGFNINFDIDRDIRHNEYDLIIIDHYIEKSENLDLMMQEMYSLLSENGFLYITMRVGSGIDILTLWEDSKIYPLEHNKLLSIDGIKILLDNNKFTLKELNTPGVLDLDNILNTESENIPKFLTYLKHANNSKVIDEFQIFLQKNLLSSFATVIAQKGLR